MRQHLGPWVVAALCALAVPLTHTEAADVALSSLMPMARTKRARRRADDDVLASGECAPLHAAAQTGANR